MNTQADTLLLRIALPLLLAAALTACDIAATEEPATDPPILARTGALAAPVLNTAMVNLTPLDRFRFRGESHFTHADHAGAARYEATFRLGQGNNGLLPADEDTYLRIGPDPQSPFSPHPCFDVFIPAGCFKPGQDGFSVDGLGCRWPCATPRVTPFVSGFRAALAPQTLRRWKASVEIDVHTFNVYPTNPCAITFAVGDDGVTNGLLDSRTQLVGIVVPEM